VNTGDFDDLDALADLAEEHDAHFHVDGAFGLFAATTPSHAHLVKGIERAGTIAGDAHKWLNVPHDSGFVFTRHLEHQIAMFKSPSAYLPPTAVDPLAFQNMSPENSRRVRALPAWVTLRAYGRSGYRELVERNCALAELFGQRIAAEPGFALFAPVRLNVVCFQLLEDGSPADVERTAAFVEQIKADGRLIVSRSMLWGQPCIRAAILNWRTTDADIDVAMDALRRCAKGAS
jgi:glutamate/tyrosine decarboxylase-like PLP-dependent enzyme